MKEHARVTREGQSDSSTRFGSWQPDFRPRPAPGPSSIPVLQRMTEALDHSSESETGSSEHGERSMEEMEAALVAASEEIEKRLDASQTLMDAVVHFPELQERFGLKRIELMNPGQSNAYLELEINPKVTITQGLSANIYTMTNQAQAVTTYGLSGLPPTKVNFKTATPAYGGGEKWGVEMEATRLGPDHPQGYPPQGQARIMNPLVTTKTNSKENKYIRGHLLNDNLGGPGHEENMFPITGKANEQHESAVESVVKDWVNTKGYYVYYKVSVTIDKVAVDPTKINDPSNVVNSKFVCHAYPINTLGTKATNAPELKQTIVSKFAAIQAPVDSSVASSGGWQGNVDTRMKTIVDNQKVEESAGKRRVAAKVPDDSITEALDDFWSDAQGLLGNLKDMIPIVKAALHAQGCNQDQAQNLCGVAINNTALVFQNGGAKNSWNQFIDALNQKKDEFAEIFSTFSKAVTTLKMHRGTKGNLEFGIRNYKNYFIRNVKKTTEMIDDLNESVLHLQETAVRDARADKTSETHNTELYQKTVTDYKAATKGGDAVGIGGGAGQKDFQKGWTYARNLDEQDKMLQKPRSGRSSGFDTGFDRYKDYGEDLIGSFKAYKQLFAKLSLFKNEKRHNHLKFQQASAGIPQGFREALDRGALAEAARIDVNGTHAARLMLVLPKMPAAVYTDEMIRRWMLIEARYNLGTTYKNQVQNTLEFVPDMSYQTFLANILNRNFDAAVATFKQIYFDNYDEFLTTVVDLVHTVSGRGVIKRGKTYIVTNNPIVTKDNMYKGQAVEIREIYQLTVKVLTPSFKEVILNKASIGKPLGG